MKKKTIGKQILAWVLAGAMMPQTSIAYAAETAASTLGPKEDILVRWIPEKDQVKAGEEGKVTLEARLNTKKSKVDRAEIEIHLEPEEAEALQLEVFDNAEEAVDWNDDGSADLYFELDSENKKLRQKLTFVVPEDVEELFDIDVDRDDITVTPYGEFDEEDGADDADMTDVGSISGVIVATQTNAADTVTTDETITDASVTDTTMATATPTDSTDADSREKPSIATPSTATSSNGSDDTRTDVEIDEGVKIRIETRILHVIGEVPEYDLSVTTVDLTGDEEADCFQFQVDAVKQEDSSALAVKEQSLSMKLELPEWISMPQQNAIWNEETSRLQMDGTDLAEITGIPDTMEVTSARVSDPQTLEVQLEKAETDAVEIDPEEEQTEDIANHGENADIHLTVALFHTSPLLQVSEDAKTAVENGESAEAIEGQIVLSAVLTTTAADLATEDEDSAVNDIKLSDLLKDEAVAVINQRTSFDKQLFWIDNQNESNIRPTTPEKYLQRFKPAITFQVEGETEQIAFTEENWRKYFGKAAMPQLEVSDDLGQLSFKDAPTQATWTSPYDRTSKTCSIIWTMKQTNLEDMGEDEKPNYLGKYSISSVDRETNGWKEGWYYIERRTLDFDIDMRIGSLIPEDPQEQTKFWEELYTSLRNVFGKRYTFYMETSLGLQNYPFEDVLAGRNSTFDPDATTFHFSLGAMWKYDLSGIPVVYYLKDNGTKGEADKITSGELRGNDGQSMLGDGSDYLEAIYNNSQVGNFGSKTDALYGGGTMLLQLRGTRGYKATKKWADEADPNNRPDGELQLWRYRDGEDFNEVAPVRDKNGDILTIALEKDPTKNSQKIVFKDSDGNPIELDKYDPEGYNYRYVVKEYLDGSNASSYEQVFGDIENEKIKDQIEGVETTRPYPDQRSGANAGNTWLYDGGVLTNRLNKKVNVPGVKVWQAATFQDDLKDTVVTMTLYYRRKNGLDTAWAKVNDPVVTATLTDFRAENEGKMTVTRNMPFYDAEGYELEYRWFETNVEQGTMETEFAEVPDTIQGGDEQTADRMFALEHRGNMVPYESENTYDENTGVSTVYNRVVDTRDYIIEKQWNGVDPKEISFYLYRTTGGLKNEQLGSFTFTKDGSLRDSSLDGMIAAELLTKWQVKLENLPRYDSKGHTYEYFLSESNDVNSIPTYNMTVDPDGTLRTLIVNGPVGTGHSILIRKNWIDDGDAAHRNLVTIGVYDQQTNEQIGDDVVIGDNEIWMKQVNIGEHNPGNVYIVEKKVGEYDALKDEKGESITEKGSQTPGLQAYRTGEHLYRVSYSHSTTGSGEQNHDIYTVSNRRIGTIDITLTKNWLDGDRTKRAALANAVEKINQQANGDPSKEIHWILKLGFDAVPDTSKYPEISGNYDYQVTMTKTGGDTVTINQDGAQQIYQTKTEGGYANPGQSWYDLLETRTLSDTSQVYHFFHIPKYDYAGDVINYRVLELWVDGNGNPVGNPGRISYMDGGETKYLNALLMDYRAFSSLNTYVVGAQYTNDQQAIGITNQLSGTKTLHWHKQWHDNYNYDSNLRPDIYLDIYRKSNAPDSTLEIYESDYRWTYQNSTVHPDSSISKRHRWTANIYDVDRYDAKGYEWRYYAREKTKVDKSQFDYTAVLYSIDGTDPSAETELGTELVPTEKAKTGDYVEQIDNSAEYALVEEGTFTNAIAGNVVIDGQKVWHNLPQTYLADPKSTLPQAVFYIDQKVDTLDEDGQVPVIQICKNVAKLPITDWNQIKDNNGYYKFGLKYLGDYTVADSEIHAPVEDEEHLIPRYNERGSLYEYSVREEMQWNKNDSWPNGVKRGDVQNVYTTTIQTYLVTNSYDSVKGALRIKKYLSLPAEMDKSRCPAVSMVLTRSYWTPDDTAGWTLVKDDTFQKEQTWNAADIKTAFAAAKTGNEDASSAILLDSTAQKKDPFLFEDLDIYAPNGAEYIYQVEEKKKSYLGGYDTWGSSGNKNESDDSANGVKLNAYKNVYVIKDLSPTWNLANSDQEKGRGKTDPSTPVAATYFNELQSVKETVTITGTKQWDEYTFQTGKRPIAVNFSKWLELDRSAKSQPGQNNAISAEKVEGTVFNVTADGSTYTYTVKVNGTDQLERYAPNGMPWNYVVKEIIPKDSPYQSTDGKKEQTVTGTTGMNDVITMKPLVNTTKTKVAYSKTWVDRDGNSLKTDYAGMGELTVNFVLQVKEEGGTTWQNASEYFKNQAELSAVDMTPSITGALTSDAWGKAYWIENLPDFVLDAQNNVKKLSYRVAETSVSQSGSTLVSWNIVERTEGDGYTLVGNNSRGTTSFIEPYYPNGGYKLNANNDHYNRLKLTDLTVTKKWANDRNNLWTTRKPTTRPGYQWELKLQIQRKTDTSWSNVKRYDSNGVGTGDLTLTLYGTNQDVTVSATIKNLPAYDTAGRQYAYRAVELDGSDDLTPVDGTAGNDTYRRTYQVTADSERTTLTNTLQTVQIAAEKFWAANDFIGKKVTLQLKYQGVDGHAHAIGTLSGAKVTLDGTADAVPTNDSTQFGYENEAWKALWTVPKVLPQELYTDGAEPGTNSDGSTIYVVEELQCDGTGNAGYRQIATSKSDDNEKYLLTNGKQMKLSIQKKWLTAAKAARKDVVIQIYRIAGSTTIPEKDIGAESLGTITLTGNTSSTLWSWSGYGFTNENGEWKSFDKYQYDPATGTSKKYLYYAREISIGGVAIGTDGKVTAGGYRYLAENPVSEIVSDSSDPDAATVMFINRQLTDIKVTKIWVDHENAYTTRPEFPDSADKPDPLKLELWRKDKTTGADWEMVSAKPTVTWNPSDKNQWIYTWTDLPYYSVGSGETYSYEVRETIPKVNDAARGQAKGSSYSSGGKTTGEIVSSGIWNGSASITNTLTGKIEITGKKVWKDENRATRPSDISLILYRWPETSSEEHKELVTTSNVPDWILIWDKTTGPDQWTYKYKNLPQFDNHGVLYVYKVVEEVTPGYRTEYHDALGREIHNLGLVTLNVQKKWETENSAQKEITVGIYRTTDLTIPADSSEDGTRSSVLIGQVTLNSGNNWEWSGDSLNETTFDQRTYGEAEEKPYLYYARELKIGSTDVPAGKAGRLVEADGYRYAVKEEMIPSALTADRAVPDSMTTVITNTQLTDLTVVKNWMDNNNQYRTRPNTPDDLELTLYRKAEDDTDFTKLTDTELTGITVEKTAGTGAEVNRWTYTWKNLPATDQNGKSYTYYVWETVPAVNPGSTLHGAAYGGRQYVCSQGTDPAHPTGIRKDADTGKTNISRHADLTNALTAHGISLSGTKLWADGAVDRPDTLGLRLWQRLDGETTETEISYEPEAAGSTANPQLLWSKSGSTWTYTFINLDGYDARGVRYHYRIEEIVPDGYRNVVLADADDSGLEDLLNIRQVQFQVEKKWRVREDSVKHPVHMKLYRTTDGQIPETSAGDAASEFLGEVSLEEANSWKWSGDQILDANGDLIYFDKYRVLDDHGQLLSAPEQYLYYAREIITDTGFLVTEAASLATASNATAVVTNQQLTDLTVVKEWLDHGNAYKTRPDHLELILYRQTEGGHREKITDRSPEVKKSAGNQWVYTWKDMPVQDVDGNPYTYDVEEQAPTLAEGARLLDASYVCLENQPVKLTNDQGKLTNYLKKETDLVGRKTWNDGQYAGRPTTVQLHLYRQADGESTWEEVTGAMPVWYRNSDDTWSFVYEKISRTNGSGAVYRYKVEEEVPKDYRVYDSKDSDGNQVFLENVGDGSLTLTKEVTGSGGELFREFHFTITVGTLPDGSRLPDGLYGGVSFRDGKAEITLKSGESVRADHLPGMVSYTVTEEEANLDRYRTTSEADQGVIQPFAVTEVKFTNSRTSDDKDRPVKPFPANTTTTGSGPGALPGPAQTEQAADDQSKKPENHIGLWVIPKTGDETPILKDILILAAAVVVLAVLLIFRKKKKK